MLLNHRYLNLCTPIARIFELMTTNKYLQNFYLESLQQLQNSFLTYSFSIQPFKSYENNHECLLNIKKNKIISNATLFKLGCAPKIMRLIHNEPFDVKVGLITSGNCQLFNFGK